MIIIMCNFFQCKNSDFYVDMEVIKLKVVKVFKIVDNEQLNEKMIYIVFDGGYMDMMLLRK